MGPARCPRLVVLTPAAPHHRQHGAWCIASGPAVRDPVPGADRCLGDRNVAWQVKIQGETNNEWRGNLWEFSAHKTKQVTFHLEIEISGRWKEISEQKWVSLKINLQIANFIEKMVVHQCHLIFPQAQMEMLWKVIIQKILCWWVKLKFSSISQGYHNQQKMEIWWEK